MTRSRAYLPGHGDPHYSVQHYDLELEYKVATNHLNGQVEVRATAVESLQEIVFDLTGLQVAKVTVDGRRPARFGHRDSRLRIRLAHKIPAGKEFIVRISYSGKPRPVRGLYGSTGWEELTDGVLVGSQPDGASSWFPCNDRIDDKATYRVSMTVPAAYHVVGNGRLASCHVRSGRSTYVYEQRQPTPTYLACVQIGRYTVTDLAADGVGVPVQVVHPVRVSPGHSSAFTRQSEMVVTFADLFGPYPFDAYRAVVADDKLEIPLEAQSLSSFGVNHLPPTWENERLVAHELAHQWFGNSLTASSWSHIWLHEGFACYAEWLWSERSGGRSAAVHAREQHTRLSRLPQDLILSNPGPKLMFDDRVYKRGALTLHRLRQFLGDETFFAALRSWTQRYAYASVTTEQFRRHLQGQAGGSVELAELLDRWLDQRPLPPLG